jgi:GNAT superfamily N-acetyltransferase
VTWSVRPSRADEPDAAALLRSYYTELVGRYHGRAVTGSEVEDAMRDEPNDDLLPPTGLLLVARYDGRPAGCVGFRRLSPTIAELTRMFVVPELRGRGGGSALLAAAERAAVDAGAVVMRLETRSDLVEARRLYARHGYREIARYSQSPYAEHWFEKVAATRPA